MEEPRQRLFQLGSRSLKKILTLQDRNPHSPTYGCFDRKFWHLRVCDFPSGMAQEFVLPLALAYRHPFPGNEFHQHTTILEWVRAGIAYAAESAHADGSCDDYYPFERATGATAFSLYAALEAIDLTGLEASPFLEFLRRRATWLMRHEESGRLSNHEALISNCLFRMARLTGDNAFREGAQRRVERLLGWQHPEEGWFYEYQGADPGYLTLTIANLAEIEETEQLQLRPVIDRSVDFLFQVQPPDGWLGGEWTSRNTNNYFPHGLEICGQWSKRALQVNDRAIAALRKPPEYDDDTIIAHHCWSFLKAAIRWVETRPEPSGSQPCHFPAAGILTLQAGQYTLLAATKKGGSFRLYRNDQLLHADTGVSLLVGQGRKKRNLVCHLWSDDVIANVDGQSVAVSGPMGYAKHSINSPMRNLALRLIVLTVGRFNPNLIRRLLQQLLITGRSGSNVRFERQLTLSDEGLRAKDVISGNAEIMAAGIGPAQTSIYTVMSRVYHHPQLQPWIDQTGAIAGNSGVLLRIDRKIPESL